MSRSIFKTILLVGVLSATATLTFNSLTATVQGGQKRFTIAEATQAVIFRTNDHNQITCSSTNTLSESNILSATDGIHFFVYEYTGDEPPFGGDFAFSSSMLRQQPILSIRNTLNTITAGNVYYIRTDRDLVFDCNTGVLNTVYECGNSVVEGVQTHANLSLNHSAEECDDGNNIDGDGCSASCIIEAVAAVCGDGLVHPDEVCDDGNTKINDGCDDECNKEIGWKCSGEPSVCDMLIPIEKTATGNDPIIEPDQQVVPETAVPVSATSKTAEPSSDIPETVDDTTNELGQAHLPPEKEDAKSSAPTVIAPKKRDTPTTSKVETDTKDSIDELSGENEQLNEVLREIERELGERESDLQEVEREKEHEEVQDKVVDSKPTPQEQQTKTAVIRFLLDPELIDTDLTDVSNRLVRYVEDINKIYAKSTVRQFVFDPDQHVEIWDKPFPTGGMCNPLKPDYEYHVIIEKSQLNRSHGGNGGCNMFNNNAISSFGYKLENIWNSNDISNDDEARDDYYRRQLRSLIHELGHGHGLGLSEYYSIGNVTDDSGIEPYIDMKATDPNNKYWASRKDLFLDPMLGTAKLDTFMEDTLFTPLGSTIINKTANDTDLSLCPGATQHMTCSAFNVSSGEKVPIEVVDDQTKKPIPGCSLKIFKLNSSNSKKIELLESPEIGDQGSYVHTWIGIPHSSTNMARLVKAYCPGYQPGGEWISVFDLQAGKVMPNGGEEGDFHFDGVLTIELTPDVTTTTPTPETAPAPIVPPTPTVTPATTPTSTQISGAPSCGDGLCNGDETQKSCSKDCGSAITCLKGQEYGYNNYTKISNASDSFSGILMQGSNFGASITSIGDFDRDGITDFAVGAPGENDGGIRQGVVYLLFMKSDKTVRSFRKLSATKSNLETNFKTNNDARLGTSITNIGDLDGNGVTDLAIGAPGEYEHGQEKGAVYIVLLKADASVKKTHKISSIEDSTGNGLDEYDNFGYAISELGDLDGDGITDIAIGSRNDDDGVKDAGAVWILFLNSDGTVKSNKKISATQGNLNEELQTRSMFGSSISNLGDLNGNGIINIAVGERNFSEDGDTHGAFWIISLNPDGTVKTSQEISKNIGGFMGDISTSDGFGLRVANAGDIDGDGTNDVIASSLYKRDLWIILPNSDGTVKSQNIFIPPVKAGAKPRSFGESLSLVGDFDGNGKPEIIVGAPEDNAGNPADEGFLGESGAIYIFELDCTGEAITTCGDGNKEGKEQCDDGNNENGDGCSNNCKTEVERLAGTESCDDGICNGNETQEDCAKDCGSAFTCSADQPYNIESYQRVPALGNATLGIANSDMFGTSIVAMGDIDGDGVTDLAIGSDADKSLGGGVIHQAGAVFILFMNEDKTIKSHKKLPSREFITYNPMNSDHMLFGRSIANIGDIDDNGVSDLAIGETQHGFYMGKTVYGAVWIALLNNDGSVKSYKLITKDEGGFTGDLKNGGFGKDIAGLGDLDGDGINDIAVGQNGNNTVWILFMNSDGTIKSHNEISESTFDFANKDSNSLDSFGDSVVNIGDLDNDGIIDIAVGEPNNKTESGSNRKAFWILFLNTDGTVKDTYKITEELSKINDKPSGNNTIANIGDLNGDHISDLAIGSLREDQLQFSINLLLMNEDGTVKESQVISSTQGGFFADLNEHTHRFGSISALGDLDKDGRTEIAVGTPMESEDGGTNKGAVYILDLGCQGETKSPVKKTITSKSATKCGDGLCNGDETQKSCSKDCGPALACADQNIVVKNVKTINDFEGNLEDVLIVGGGFGHSMTPLGDMNGDGVTDLAIGGADTNNKENSIFILFMNANKTVKSYKTIKGTDFYYDDNQNAHQQFGNSIANIGDIDGNGVTDIAIGEKYYKRYTFMTWSGSKSKSEYAFTGAIWIALLNSDRTVKSYNLISDGEGGFEGYLTKDGMFGQSVTGLGDLDGDGINDVAVGEPGANATWILFLDNDGAVKDHIKISNQQLLDSGWKPAESDISPDLDDFGSSVSNIGDMDGDGVIDIAVGESMDQNQNNMGGALWILFMNNNGTVKNAVKTRSEDAGLIRNQYLNGGIASVGDLDSNGVSDLVVEALNENGFYILFMNSDGTVMSSKTFSKKNGGLKEDILLNKYSGESIGSLGDFDGDGNPDVLIGAPKDNHGGTGKGAIFFVNLSCFAECEDECTISDTTECLSKSEYGTCGDYDDDNCLEWGEKGTCDAGKECYGAGTCSNGPTAWCGDGICNEKETQDSCSRDCGAPAMCAKNIYGVIDYKEISVKDKEVFEDGQYITGFGSAIAHIGDVDKDGINDLAVAIEGSLEGYGIYILLMNEDGSIKSYKSILSDQYAYEQKEKVVDVAALGDFDGDQTPDIAIVSDTSGVTNPINTHILYLNTDGTLKSSQRLQDKSSADSELVLKESSITNMGDMDGDGITDIAIGGHAIKNSKDIPTVSVLFMNQDGSIKKYRQTSDSKTEFTPDRGFYGRSIDAIGDIDGDGITDLAVGSQDSVWIQFLNSDGSVKSSQKIDSKTKNLGFSTHRTMFGADVSNIGDINGDGINDLLVGNYSNDQEDRIVGKAHILLLNVDGTVKSSSTISDTNDGGIGVEFRKGIDFGWSVSHIGDFDKDGNLNILVSAPHNGYDGWVNQYGSVYNINFGCYPSTDASEVTQSKGRFSSFWASLFEFFFTNTK